MMKRYLIAFLFMEVFAVSGAFAGSYHTERGIVFADLGTQKLRMTMYVPDGDSNQPRPGMVLIHGGGWILGTRYQQSWYCRNFAKSGYVVMTIDYRLMPRNAFPSCLHDCKAAVRWMRQNAAQYNIDTNRIVTFGASAGGHLAALLAATVPEDGLEGDINPGPSSEVRAAISLYGAVDLTQYRDNPIHGRLSHFTARFMTDFTARTLGPQNGTSIEAASPITYARATTKPILFVHGTDDHLVHYEQSVRFERRLKELGVPTRLITLPGRGHGFDYIYMQQRKAIFQYMLDFLREQGCAP